jgi:hypothetical protein
MSASTPAQVLIVANRTAATPPLIEAVRERAARGRCEFTLLVPQLAVEEVFGDEEARRTIELAVPLLEEAAAGTIEPIIGPADAMRAVQSALDRQHFDEVIISTLPERVSHWLKRDLPTKVARLGLPVTVVHARTRRRPIHDPVQIGGV